MARHVHRLVLLLALPLALSGALGGLTTGQDNVSDPSGERAVVRFGADAGSLTAQREAGFTPDLATVWVGPWTLKHGWAGTDKAIRSMVDADVQPVIHFYYWGDDLSVRCLDEGCWSTLHDTHKDTATWQRLAAELVTHLHATARGAPVVVVLETEFNRGNVARHEPLDAHLAEKAEFLREGYPAAEIVLGLGNWNRDDWDTWDRAAAASDMVGFQVLRGSTRDTPERYANAVNASLEAAKRIQTLFERPILIHDLGLSSHPEPGFALHQARTMRDLFEALPDLKAAGVQAVMYRAWFDNPRFDTSNHYGVAERHWGLAWPRGDGHKPAADVWMAAVMAERGGAAPDWPAVDPIPVGRAGFALAGEEFVSRRGGALTTDGRANDGTAWSMDHEGSLLQPMRFEPGTYRVEVRTRAPALLPSDVALRLSWDDTPMAWFRPGLGYTMEAATVELAGEGHFALELATNMTTAPKAALLVDHVRLVWLDGPPELAIDVTVDGMAVELDARDTIDRDGDEMVFRWTLGDGTSAVGPRVLHRYDEPGAYEVTLTVDAGNETAFTSRTVHAAEPDDEGSAGQWAGAVGLGLVALVGVLVWLRRHG